MKASTGNLQCALSLNSVRGGSNLEGPIPDEYIALAGILIFCWTGCRLPWPEWSCQLPGSSHRPSLYSVICSRNMKGTACNGENVFAENAMMVVACDIQGTLSIDGESSFE